MRVPRALGQLLSTFGGQSPTEMEDRLRLTLESMQFYGSTQLQSGFTNNAAAAENAGTVLTLSATAWTVLFATHGTVVKTATMTALRARVSLNRGVQFSPLVWAAELGPFGATETGTVNFGGYLPYPLLCPPGSLVSVVPEVIGTDATANVSIFAEFGVLG